MTKAPTEDVLREMPKLAPKAKPQVNQRPPATKAEQARYKRSDKTSFKPAPR